MADSCLKKSTGNQWEPLGNHCGKTWQYLFSNGAPVSLEALRLNHISSVSGDVKFMKLDVDGTGGQGMSMVYVNALNYFFFRKRAKSMP